MRKKKLLSIILLVIASFLFFSNTLQAKPTIYALVIGVGKYKEHAWDTLKNKPFNDAHTMEKIIRTHFKGKKSIQVLTNSDATEKNIIESLANLENKVSSGDTVIFYYSGHGKQVKNDNPEEDKEEDGLDEVIVGYDAYFLSGTIKHIIRDDTLEKLFSNIEKKGAYVLVIMDSCHSGTISKSFAEPLSVQSSKVPNNSNDKEKNRSPAFSEELEKHGNKLRRKEKVLMASTKSRTIWTAAASAQKAFIDANMENSVFTTLLTEGIDKKREGSHCLLADKNCNGIVSNVELYLYISNSSKEYCEDLGKETCSRNLTPTLEIYDDYFTQSFTALPTLKISKPSKSSDIYNILEESLVRKLSNDIELKIKHPNEPNPIKKGEKIFFKVKSKISGHLILLDVTPSGKMVQIFPNAEHPNDKIKAGKHYFFPDNDQQSYEFYAKDKGKGRLYAIITEDPINLDGIIRKDLDPVALENPIHLINQLGNKLNAPWTGDKVTRMSHYSVTATDYTVY